jgi:hypothetical protein
MDGLCKLHLLFGQVIVDVFGELTRQDQHAIERRPQLV